MFYEIGAAHALGKLSVIVARKDLAGAIPPNIGHDAVLPYANYEAGWPDLTVSAMAALIAMLTSAARRGERLRISSDTLTTTIAEAGRTLMSALVPLQAREAMNDGSEKFKNEDYQGARAQS